MADGERPLDGRRVLVTRAREQLADLVGPLERLGATAIGAPAIQFSPPPDWSPLDEALGRIAEFDFVLFTSQNTLPRVEDRMRHLGIDLDSLNGPALVAIGTATARGLRDRGYTVDLVPDEFRAEGIVELLAHEPLEGKRVLLPRALVAREELPRGLRERGAEVVVAPVYETTADPEGMETAREALTLGVDAITFTSSSTVHYFLEGLGVPAEARWKRAIESAVLASIGPITSGTLRRAGFEPGVEADPFTVDALVRALQEHFSRS